jgi:hypothetical protein
MVRRIGLGVLLVGLAGLAGAFPRAAADDKKADKDGWVQLFNGKDLTGWVVPPDTNKGAFKEVVAREKGGTVVAFVGLDRKTGKEVPLWRVEDGVLVGSGPASHLFSKRGDYENFHFRVEAMINDKGNSGQYFRTQLGPGFPKGYEAQINATHGDRVKTGSLYPAAADMRKVKEIQVLDKAPHKPDEWFTQEVIAKGPHIVILVNGKKTVDWTDPKARYKKGHFALQGHDPGSVVKFRKIEVKELPAEK